MGDEDDDANEDREEEGEEGAVCGGGGNRNRNHARPPPTRERLRPTADGAHFHFTPYVDDSELRKRLASQVRPHLGPI